MTEQTDAAEVSQHDVETLADFIAAHRRQPNHGCSWGCLACAVLTSGWLAADRAAQRRLGAEAVVAAVEKAYALPARVDIDREGTCDACAEHKHLVASYPEPDNEPWICAECAAEIEAPLTAARAAAQQVGGER